MMRKGTSGSNYTSLYDNLLFQTFVDFQYLPMMRKGTSGSNHTSLYDNLLFQTLLTSNSYRWWVRGQVGQIIPRYISASTKSSPMCHGQKKQGSLVSPPTIFSRIDNPSEYNCGKVVKSLKK